MLRRKNMLILSMLLIIIGTFGCAQRQIINVDGMPISNHEYQLQSEETGIRLVFTLTRYYREYEGKEYLTKPEYMDALHEKNLVDPHKSEALGLHVKVINLRNMKYSFRWEITAPKERQQSGLNYYGKLSRKDFYLPLPIDKSGDYEYRIMIEDSTSNDLFELPQMRYTVKGGVEKVVTHK